MLLEIISWIATGGSLFGQILINKRNKLAFPVWITSNLLWIVVNIIGTFNLANVIMYVVYTIFNISGYINWRKAEKFVSEKEGCTKR